MRNPNDYDDDAYARASSDLINALEAVWEAGVEFATIESDIESGLENAGLERLRVDHGSRVDNIEVCAILHRHTTTETPMKIKDIKPDTQYIVDTDAMAKYFGFLNPYGLNRAFGEAAGTALHVDCYVTVKRVGIERLHGDRKDGVSIEVPQAVYDFLSERMGYRDEEGNFVITARCIEQERSALQARIAQEKSEQQEREDAERVRLASNVINIPLDRLGSLYEDDRRDTKEAAKDLLRQLRDLRERVDSDIATLEAVTTHIDSTELRPDGYYYGDLAPRENSDGVMTYGHVDDVFLPAQAKRTVDALQAYERQIRRFNRWQYMRANGGEN